MVKYPREYFEDEYREGFLVERDMKCAWAAQIEVLRHIAEVCEKHGLKYFAFFGTLLGAIRHHGFIPWDDDIDIAMMRDDYQKFLQVCKTELPEEYCVLNCYDYPEWEEINIRITNGDYIDISEKRMKEYYGCPFSVGVDIYPLDTIPDDPAVLNQELDILNLLANTHTFLTNLENAEETSEQDKWRNQTLENLQRISEILEYEFDYDRDLHNQLYQLFDQMCQVFSGEEGRMVAVMATYIKGTRKMAFDKLWLRESIDYPFEYGTIKVPIGFEACLWARFGVNYMVPRQIKASHDYPFYKEQKEMLEESGKREIVEKLSKQIIQLQFQTKLIESTSVDSELKNDKLQVCYRISIVEFMTKDWNQIQNKIMQAVDIFEQASNNIELVFVPDNEILLCIDDSDITCKYQALVDDICKKGFVQYVPSGYNEKIISAYDAFYGDENAWTYVFKKMKKPILIEKFF